jgi:hypothetical protein
MFQSQALDAAANGADANADERNVTMIADLPGLVSRT